MTNPVVTPFPRDRMKTPPAEGARPALLAQLDVPQAVRNNASGLHRLSANVHAGLGGHWATPTVMDEAEEKLAEIAERALALRAALVQERKRRAAGGQA